MPPASLEIVEGEGVTLPFTLSPLGTQAKVEADEGLDAAVDAGTLRVRALLSGGDDLAIRVTLSSNGQESKVTVPVHVRRMAWGARVDLVPQGIEAREHPSLLLDAARSRVVMVGGSGYKPQGMPLGDVWGVSLSDGKATAITPAGTPPGAAASRRVVQHDGEAKAWLWGGYTDAGDLAEMFEVDLATDPPTFTTVQQTNPPPARSLHFFGRDAKTGTFAVFGGVGSNKMLDDLWTGTLSGGTLVWKKVDVAGDKPSKRYGFFFGVDQADGVAYVFSGAQGLAAINPARDLWKLDLRADPPAWTKVLDGEQVPEGRRNGAFAYDQAHRRLYVWGGTPDAKASAPGLFAYDARPGIERWYTLDRPGAPVIRSSGAAIVDPATGTVRLGFGNDKGIFADLTPLGP